MITLPRIKNTFLTLLIAMCLASCSEHKTISLAYQAPIQQGNVFNDATIAKLHTGMSQQEVSHLLGHPVLIDPYHTSTWTYVYRLQEQGHLSQKRHLVLNFSADKRLSRIETDAK